MSLDDEPHPEKYQAFFGRPSSRQIQTLAFAADEKGDIRTIILSKINRRRKRALTCIRKRGYCTEVSCNSPVSCILKLPSEMLKIHNEGEENQRQKNKEENAPVQPLEERSRKAGGFSLRIHH